MLFDFRAEIAYCLIKKYSMILPKRGRPRSIDSEIEIKRRKPNLTYILPSDVLKNGTHH